MKILFFVVFVSFSAHAINPDMGYLKKEDQQFFQNEGMAGMNKQERIDANVKEINKLHGEIAKLKSEMAELRSEVEALKNKK